MVSPCEKEFDAYSEHALKIAKPLVKQVADAEDLAQDACCSLWADRLAGKEAQEHEPWICGHLRHGAADHWRMTHGSPEPLECDIAREDVRFFVGHKKNFSKEREEFEANLAELLDLLTAYEAEGCGIIMRNEPWPMAGREAKCRARIAKKYREFFQIQVPPED